MIGTVYIMSEGPKLVGSFQQDICPFFFVFFSFVLKTSKYLGFIFGFERHCIQSVGTPVGLSPMKIVTMMSYGLKEPIQEDLKEGENGNTEAYVGKNEKNSCTQTYPM